MRWKSSLGFKTVERLLHDLNLEFASDTTESEWMSSSVHAHAKIELVCTECGSCCSPTLNNLVRNRSVACLCNGMARSFQKTMYIRIVNQLHSKHLRLVNVDSYESYAALSPTTHTKLDVVCTNCGVPGSPKVNSILSQKSGIPCRCNGGILYASAAKYAELTGRLSEKSLRLNDTSTLEEWIALAAVSTTRIAVSCSLCGAVATYQCHALFTKSTVRTLCGCVASSHLPVASVGKYNQVVERVRTSRFVLVDGEPTLEEWKRLVSSYRGTVELQCTRCTQITSPSIEKLLEDKVGCGCNNSSQARVLAFVKDVIGHVSSGLRAEWEYGSSITGRGGGELRYDIAVVDPSSKVVIVVEVDGGHHFGGGHAALKRRNGRQDWTIEHDLMKEWKAVETGQVMLRIEARTVESNQMSWNAWIQKRLTDSLLGIVSPGIHRLSSGRQYASEAYASPRSGTVLATESDLTLHPFPLPFPDRLD